MLEQTGLIVDLGCWAITEALEDSERWAHLDKDFRVCVNISAQQLIGSQSIEKICKTIKDSGIFFHTLTLEVNERLFMVDGKHLNDTMHEMQAKGVRFSLDDIGTGYSSLNHLKRFPIDAIKIDQTIIRDMLNNEEEAALITTMMSIAANLKLEVIAEGVEIEEQASFLEKVRCHIVHGSLYSLRVAADKVAQVIKKNRG